MMDKPLVVREWEWDGEFIWTRGDPLFNDGCCLTKEHNALVYSFRALRQLADEHFAAIGRLDAELRSRPTREEHQRIVNQYAEIVQGYQAKLAASEAERERLREALVLAQDHLRAWGDWDGVEECRAALAPAAGPEEGE